MEWLGRYGRCLFNFVENCQAIFQSDFHFTSPPQESSSYENFVQSVFLILDVLISMHVVASHSSFSFLFLFFLMTGDVEHLICLFAICVFALVKCLPIFGLSKVGLLLSFDILLFFFLNLI